MTQPDNSSHSPRQVGRLRGYRVLRWLEYGCWLGGGMCVGFLVLSLLGIHSFQAAQTKRLEALRQTGVVTIRPGDPLGRVAIPRIGISAIVAEGDDKSTLDHAVGHIPGTPGPGSGGNVGLAAHRDTFFRALAGVRLKDLIVLETAQGKYEYEVARIVVVDPEQTEVLDSSDKAQLTLVTCYPFHYIGAAPRRFVVQASRLPVR